MPNDKTVTWLLPVRNGMPYLPLTLESISRQTYPHQRVIAWDNGSSDGTQEELARWISTRLPGLVVAGKPLSLGLSLAEMVKTAQSDLCAVMHGDDINLPRRLEMQVDFLERHPEVAILGTQIEMIDEDGSVLKDQASWVYRTGDAEIRWRSRWHTQFCHPSVMFRRSAVLAAGNYRDLQPYEDADLWLRLANSRQEMRNLDEVLVQYRRTDMSLSGGVSDFLPLEREAAALNSASLFPGITDPFEAMELWEATHPHHISQPNVAFRFRFIRQLAQAAKILAENAGKPPEYITDTDTFKDQYYCLKTRFRGRMGLMPLVHLRQRLTAATHRDRLL